MKKVLLGVGIGVATELVFSLGIYTLLSHLSPTYINSSPFIFAYPLVACLIIATCLLLAKQSYKIVLGLFAGYLLVILALSFLLVGV
jgi:hypothetical protein